MADRTPVTRQPDIIDAGRCYGVIRSYHNRLAGELSDKWSGKSEAWIPDQEKARIVWLYSNVKTDVYTLQMRFRNEALLEAGIPEQYLPGIRIPFRHDHSLGLILPVEESVARKVEGYYEPAKDRKPHVRFYGNLAGIDPLKYELSGSMETAKKQVKYFMDTRDKAMKEILALYYAEVGQ
jgi:hypothetical protein